MPAPGSRKSCLISGAAPGQGCSHAIQLTQERADVIAVDLAAQTDAACAQRRCSVARHAEKGRKP